MEFTKLHQFLHQSLIRFFDVKGLAPANVSFQASGKLGKKTFKGVKGTASQAGISLDFVKVFQASAVMLHLRFPFSGPFEWLSLWHHATSKAVKDEQQQMLQLAAGKKDRTFSISVWFHLTMTF